LADSERSVVAVELSEFVVNIGVAAVLGGAIGFERQLHQRKAGLRTNILVALGSAAFVTLGALVPHEDSQSRVAASVVSGVGFLGAGVIFKDGATIRGLDTAATVWCSAAVGALAGWGQLLGAAFTAAIVLLTNTLVRPFVKRIDREASTRQVYNITLVCAEGNEHGARDLLLAQVSRNDLMLRSIQSVRSRDAEDRGHHTISAELVGTRMDRREIEKAATVLTGDPRIESVAWRVDEGDANASE